MTLLFPHDGRRGTEVMRRNVSIKTLRADHAKTARQSPAVPWEFRVFLRGYFAAVGSGCGLSDSELR